MSSLATSVGKKVARHQLKKRVGLTGQKPNSNEIDWNDFNYPPHLNLFHFDLDEIIEEQRHLFKMLNYFFLAFFGLFALNFLNAIIQISVGYSWTRIFSSFFYFSILFGLSGLGFYNVFQAGVTMKEAGDGTQLKSDLDGKLV